MEILQLGRERYELTDISHQVDTSRGMPVSITLTKISRIPHLTDKEILASQKADKLAERAYEQEFLNGFSPLERIGAHITIGVTYVACAVYYSLFHPVITAGAIGEKLARGLIECYSEAGRIWRRW